MIIALITLSIVLLLSIAFNVKLAQMFFNTLNAMTDMQKEFEEVQFMEGYLDIPEEDILEKFEDVSLVCQTLPTKDGEMMQVFDTSLYMKNKIIGLTYFVPEQTLQEVNSSLRDNDAIMKKIRRKLEEMGAEFSDTEEEQEYFQEIVNRAMEYEDVQQVPRLEHCTVYHLKDGRWIWRQEEVEDEDAYD